MLKETISHGSYTQSVVVTSSLEFPIGLALDSAGNLFVADVAGNNKVFKEDVADSPSLSFAATSVGATSTDSPQTINVENVGNAALSFPVPGSGNNPSISANFILNSGEASACSVVDGGSGAAGTLAAGASCDLSISFVPTAMGPLTGSIVLTDNNSPAAAPRYTTQTIKLSGTGGIHSVPTIIWASPPPITYGTALSSAQLAATSIVAGTFVYSPAAGSVLSAGSQTLKVTFIPTDTAGYTTATAIVTLTVSQATPTITWSTPAAITFGTTLGTMQLDAASSVAGRFSYSPGAGTLPGAGTQTLSASFSPTDATDYTTASAMNALVVEKATASSTLVSLANPAFVSNAVTFVATFAPSAGTLAGTVSFYDGTTLMGAQPLGNNVATYTTSALTSGTHSISAVYAGDGNFAAVTSAAVSEGVEDFSVGPPMGGLTTATVSPGGQAIFTLAMAPPNGEMFAAPITFAVTGLPSGATATFSPISIAAGAGATNVTMTVTLPTTAKAEPKQGPWGRGGLTVALGLLLIPFVGRRRQSKLDRFGCWIVVGIGTAILFAFLTGCAGGGSGGTAGAQLQNFTLTVTATSGSLSHTTTLHLTVD